MKEIVITSSVLILALLALRGIFRKTLSRRVQYALWGLVALRLLVPVNLPAAQHSVLTVTEPVRTAITERMETPHEILPQGQARPSNPAPASPAENGAGTATTPGTNSGASPVTTPVAPAEPAADPAGNGAASTTPAATGESNAAASAGETQTAIRFTTAQALTALWLLGAVGMAAWFFVSNLRFARFLRRNRQPFPVEGCTRPVYLVEEGLPSPCLAGLLRPAVYLTPAVAGDAQRLRHVLAHELTHARHLDPLWSFVRCLCLTLYWFDPLVWVAAYVSRSDCELACDEGAIHRLGEGERIPYGETLLSLIPVGRADPMLSATTMTAGKRQLRERIRRIASARRPAAAAVFAVLCAASILCAATFTGAVSASQKPNGTLSGAEIAYFNQNFFNQEDYPEAIRGHFLTCEYEKPENIDLYELFYCGVPVAADDTRAQELRLAENGPDAPCPTDILPVSAMDAVLQQYTGLRFADMDASTLEGFDHPEEGYYTHTHGDTNYYGELQVYAGYRDGETVVLYYTPRGTTAWHRVTLQEGRDGGYQFQSNLPCEMPAIAPRLPETGPVLTLSLADAEAVTPGPVNLTHRSNDCQEEGSGYSITGGDGEDYSIVPYRSTDGKLYVAVVRTDWVSTGGDGTGYATWEADTFLTIPEQEDDARTPDSVTLGFFDDLFGRSGFTVEYSDENGQQVWEYYYLPVDGTPYLLLRTTGSGWLDQTDLDGDGENELYSSNGSLYFLRDGQLYVADVKALLQAAWPDLRYWDWSHLDQNYRHIVVSGFVRMPEWDEPDSNETDYLHEPGGSIADFYRYLYFDGENILVYQDLQNVTYTDHLASTVDVPSDVATAAKARILENYQAMQEDCPDFPIDDWRVTSVTLEESVTLADGRRLEIYQAAGQFHAMYPARRALTGNIWLGEDGWFSGYTSRSPYLAFIADGGKRALVESDLPDDSSPGSWAFDADTVELLLKQGYTEISDLDQETLMAYFYFHYYDCLDRIAQLPEAEWDDLLNSLRDYPDRSYFRDAIYNLLHSPSGLTEDAAKCYRRLLTLENSDGTRTPISVELMCDAAIETRFEAARSAPAYVDAALVNWQNHDTQRVADYPDFHGIHLEVYRVDYFYGCQYPEKVRTEGGIRVSGDRVIPSPDGSAYALFEVKEDLHRVCLGDTDIRNISPEKDPAAFQQALEDYLRIERPGEIDSLGQDITASGGTPLYLWEKGSRKAAEDYVANFIGAFQTSSQQVLDGGWDLWTYQKDGSWYLFLIGADGRYAQLPLPVCDGALRYAEPATSYQSGGPVRWEARVSQDVYSAATGTLAQESGVYRYQLDLETLRLYESFTPTKSGSQDASFAAQTLSTHLCAKSQEELTAWLAAGESAEAWDGHLPTGSYWSDGSGAVAYLVTLTGTAHAEQYQLYLRFADGREAQLLLPTVPNSFTILAPGTAGFADGTFTYDIDAAAMGSPGSVYHYTVDLSAKTIAMTVIK